MAITGLASIGALQGERPKRRSFKLNLGGNIMAMRGGKKKKKNKRGGTRGGKGRK